MHTPKRWHQSTKPTYEEILSALGEAELTGQQILNLTQKLDDLYSLQVNKITQTFPTDLWSQIVSTALIPKLPPQELLPLRFVCRDWNHVICSFPKLNKLIATQSTLPKILQLFPSLKSLKLSTPTKSKEPFDFLALTGFHHLNIHDKNVRWSPDQLAPLTNLKKLTFFSSKKLTTLEPLTFLQCLSLRNEAALFPRSAVDQLPLLTRLVSDSKHVFTHGTGVFKEGRRLCYEGAWKDCKFDGQGTYFLKNGSFYQGTFENGNYHGKGVYNHSEGHRYEGEFRNDEFHGEGIMHYAKGGVFTGQWRNDTRHKGAMTYLDGDIYDGDWIGDKPHGYGKVVSPNGNTFEGTWLDGKKGHGRGTRNYGPYVYVGQFEGNTMHGQGTQLYPNGNKFVGNFQQHNRVGHGTFYFVTSNDGQYKFVDAETGQEVPIENGDRFEGEMSFQKRVSQGILIRESEGNQTEGCLTWIKSSEKKPTTTVYS